MPEMKAANSSGPIVTTKLKAGNMPASRFTLDLGLQSGWLPIRKLLHFEAPEGNAFINAASRIQYLKIWDCAFPARRILHLEPSVIAHV